MNKPNSRIHTRLKNHALVVVPPPPSRFTLEEWYLNNEQRYRTCFDQQTLADRVLAESDRVREQVQEITLCNRREADHKLDEKIKDIEFIKNEIQLQRKEVCIEIESLLMYIERMQDAMEALREKSLKICRKCYILREGRLGIDLCHDSVEDELLREIEVIEGSQMLIKRALEQSNEQVRRLKSTTYFMDRDLEDKGNVHKIDSYNLSLRETSLNLSIYHGFAPLDPANITTEEWQHFTTMNIERAAKEINSARQLRCYIDTLLKQVIEDLTDQYNCCNQAFRDRIEEMKEAKAKLEKQHFEIVRQANEMTRNITRLEKAIAEKEGFMALAHTRLGNRAQRPGIELCKDLVETCLVHEVSELRETVSTLQQMLVEAQASLRYLLKTQIQLEEDINVKTNTLKIDEVDCMTLRQGMEYHAY